MMNTTTGLGAIWVIPAFAQFGIARVFLRMKMLDAPLQMPSQAEAPECHHASGREPFPRIAFTERKP